MQQELSRTPARSPRDASLLARLASNNHPVIAGLTKHPDEQVRWWAIAVARQAQALAGRGKSPSALGDVARSATRSLAICRVVRRGWPCGSGAGALERIEKRADAARHRPAQLGVVGNPGCSADAAGEHRDWLSQLKQSHRRSQQPGQFAGWPRKSGWPAPAKN